MTPFTWKTGAQKRTKRIQHYGKSFAYATGERPIGITMTDTGKSVQADGRSRPPGIPSKRQQGLGDNTDTMVEQLSPGDPTPNYSKTQSSAEKLTSTPQADTLKSVDRVPFDKPARVDGACTGCGMDLTTNHLKTYHAPRCKGKCERCRDLGLVCKLLDPNNTNCQNCTNARLPCSGPVTHNEKDVSEIKATALRQRSCFVDGICERCGISIDATHAQYRHGLSCLGKCRRCSELDLVCSHHYKSHACSSCATEGLPCSGPVTHIHENPWAGTCSRCGVFTSPIDKHEWRCLGKCQPCADKNEICTGFSGNSGCSRCRVLGISCGGRVTHPDAAPDSTLRKKSWECEWCGTEIIGPGYLMTLHRAWCQGKCRHCQEQQLPYSFGKSKATMKSTCDTCEQQGKQCSSPVTHISIPADTPCPRCRRPLKGNSALILSHVERCKGRCKPCSVSGEVCIQTGGRCEACRQAGRRCGGGITHKDVATAAEAPKAAGEKQEMPSTKEGQTRRKRKRSPTSSDDESGC